MQKETIVQFVLIAFILFVYSGVAYGDSISNYKVPLRVPLNETLTIFGVYSAANTLCAFYIFDLNNSDSNGVVTRLNDLYSFSDGSFYQEKIISEPLFRRGMDYNAVTKCGTTETGAVFTVIQKEDITLGISAAAIKNDLSFWIDSNNSVTVIIIGFLIFTAAIVFVIGWSVIESVSGSY